MYVCACMGTDMVLAPLAVFVPVKSACLSPYPSVKVRMMSVMHTTEMAALARTRHQYEAKSCTDNSVFMSTLLLF